MGCPRPPSLGHPVRADRYLGRVVGGARGPDETRSPTDGIDRKSKQAGDQRKRCSDDNAVDLMGLLSKRPLSGSVDPSVPSSMDAAGACGRDPATGSEVTSTVRQCQVRLSPAEIDQLVKLEVRASCRDRGAGPPVRCASSHGGSAPSSAPVVMVWARGRGGFVKVTRCGPPRCAWRAVGGRLGVGGG